MKPIVIIGSGLAGYGVAREFRKLNKETPLIIITADDGRAYSKPMLSNALGKGKTPVQLATATSTDIATQLDAEIRTQSIVTAIESDHHTISIDGETIEYSKLVLALGATPFQPPIEGNATDRVYSINSLNDYSVFREAITDKKSISILGGGLIGCEFANDLATSGYIVNVIDRNNWPLGQLIPEPLGIKLQQSLEAIGVEWYKNNTVKCIDSSEQQLSISLESGEKLLSDVVLSAIGLRTELSLAQQAGIQTNRGIIVNEKLESSAKDIFALGDCAEVNSFFMPFIMPLMKCTKALAQTLNDNSTSVSYPAMPVTLKTPAFPISVLPPAPAIKGSWEVEMSDDAVRALFKDSENQIKGFAFGGKATAEANKLALTLPSLF